MSAETSPGIGSRQLSGLAPTIGGKPFAQYLEGLLVTKGAPTQAYAAGETVFEEGDGGAAAYLIRAGSIDIVSRAYDGTERLLNRLGNGELFGEMALLDQTRRSASAIAREETVLFVIPRDDVLALLRQVPEMALWMLKRSSHRLRVLTRLVSEMEQAHEVNLKILSGQEAERRRIGRDIHDGVAQSIADCIIRLQLADRLLDRDVDQARSELRDLQDALREGLEKIRDLVRNLYPAELGRIGLVGATERFVQRMSGSAGVGIAFEHPGLEGELPPALEATLYCIVQEALNNVKKHARASHADVLLSREGGRLSLVIADDGCGFDVDALTRDPAYRDCFGLLSMEERARLAGGTMDIESTAGGGTTLRFSLPVGSCS